MDEETRQEEIAAMVGTLSAVDLQLRRVEQTALERASVFLEEARRTEAAASPQFNTMGHVLREIGADVRRIRAHIDALENFLRAGAPEGFTDERGDAGGDVPTHPS
jgi:hypothetical protein